LSWLCPGVRVGHYQVVEAVREALARVKFLEMRFMRGIRRITATPLYFKAENWRLDMPGISVYPGCAA
jgi:hypothetical protein